MRWLALLASLSVSLGAAGQDQPPPKKKPVAKKTAAKAPAAKKKDLPKAHAKPTPEQIRKFNELQKNR